MSLCHNILTHEIKGKTEFYSTSSDEYCLVKAADEMGYSFFYSNNSIYKILVDDEEKVYQVLGINEFS